METPALWSEMVTQNSGESLAQISDASPVLLVFLRHFGCSFCREAISDIAKRRKSLESSGVRVVLVHMAADRSVAEKFFKKYKLLPVDHISDPDKRFYRAFGLGKGTPTQLFGLMNWIRGFQAGVVEGHGFAYHSEEIGDGFQMPGVFVLHKGEVKHTFIHEHAWDRPDYEKIVEVCDL
ncbi:MAG: redoxin domain-containing protein [Bacteroidetes bacterium]|nr:MAG: redoxin domain-containing protein [Bacteroidota bacterium]